MAKERAAKMEKLRRAKVEVKTRTAKFKLEGRSKFEQRLFSIDYKNIWLRRILAKKTRLDFEVQIRGRMEILTTLFLTDFKN
jgi:hypothetical protein